MDCHVLLYPNYTHLHLPPSTYCLIMCSYGEESMKLFWLDKSGGRGREGKRERDRDREFTSWPSPQIVDGLQDRLCS